MFCQNCSAVLEEGVKFCPGCGARMETPAPVEPKPAAPVEPKPAAPVYQQPAAPVYRPIGAPVVKAEKKRTVPVAALLFTALAIGVRGFLQLFTHADRLGFWNSLTFFTYLLLFLSALFLLLCLAKELPEGKRPVLGGIALLFVCFACALAAGSYMTGGRGMFRWPRIAYLICYLVCAVLFLISAIIALSNHRFAVVGMIGAIVYILLQILIMSVDIAARSKRLTMGYTFFELLQVSIMPVLSRVFYGIALLIFSLQFRPAKK